MINVVPTLRSSSSGGVAIHALDDEMGEDPPDDADEPVPATVKKEKADVDQKDQANFGNSLKKSNSEEAQKSSSSTSPCLVSHSRRRI